MKEPSQNKKKVKRTCEKHEEFCECRECHLRYGPGITRILEGQVKPIEMENKGFIDNIRDMNSTEDVDKSFQ